MLGESIISLDTFIKRDPELVLHIFIGIVIQYIKSIPEVFRIIVLESAEYPVPQGEDITVIRVSVRPFVMMMDFMHVGRHKNPAYRLINPKRNSYIGMVKMSKKGGTA